MDDGEGEGANYPDESLSRWGNSLVIITLNNEKHGGIYLSRLFPLPQDTRYEVFSIILLVDNS